MNIKSITISLMALFTVVIATSGPVPVQAQNAGFQIGRAQPQNPQPQTLPSVPGLIQPMTSPIQPTGNPILPLGGGIPRSQNVVVPEVNVEFGNNFVTVLPAGGTVFVPAGTLVIESSPGMQPGAFLSAPLPPAGPSVPLVPQSPGEPGMPNGSRGGNTSLQRSNRTSSNNPANNGQPDTASTADTAKQDVTRLALGTPREKVIEKFGNPVAFMMNMNGETLYFNGGVVVFVKNGVVAAPEIQDGAIRQ